MKRQLNDTFYRQDFCSSWNKNPVMALFLSYNTISDISSFSLCLLCPQEKTTFWKTVWTRFLSLSIDRGANDPHRIRFIQNPNQATIIFIMNPNEQTFIPKHRVTFLFIFSLSKTSSIKITSAWRWTHSLKLYFSFSSSFEGYTSIPSKYCKSGTTPG